MASESNQKNKINISDEPFEIDCYNVDRLVKTNNLQEITDPIYLDIGNAFTPEGLFSNQIFGRTKDERSTIFAYINLKSYFIQPLAYITLKKVYSKLDNLLMREIFVKMNVKGYIEESTEDDGGETGIEFLYKHWGKIKFERNNSMVRTNRIKFIESLNKDEFFIDKWLVIPPFYRDLKFAGDKVISADKINDFYTTLIRLSKVMERERNSGALHVVSTITRFKMQTTLVQIYKYFTSPPNLSKKYGIIRSSLLGKNIDYATRLVISAPTYDQDRWDEVPVKFDRCGVPLGALVVLFYPFFQNWLMNYFKKEFVDRQFSYPHYNIKTNKFEGNIELDNPEGYFTADYIDKQLKSFVNSYGDRFRQITVPTKDKGFIPVGMAGRLPEGAKYLNLDNIVFTHNLTWTDLIYRAAVEITSDKTVVVTRYPLEDYFGVTGFKIHVLSTINTTPMQIGDKIYTHYPIVDTRMDQSEVSIQFVNTLIMANCFLGGFGADYDGDQVTVKGNFTVEANKEMEEFTKSKKNILTIGGDSNRGTINEALQAIYSLTID